jgi:hypothetical protein
MINFLWVVLELLALFPALHNGILEMKVGESTPVDCSEA